MEAAKVFKKSSNFLTYFDNFAFYKKVRTKRVKDDQENITFFMDRSSEILHNVSDIMGRLQEDILKLKEAIQTADQDHQLSEDAQPENESKE